MMIGMNSDKGTVHIVDDDASFRTAIGRLLRASGYGVAAYETGIEALSRISNNERGCILLDLRMPGLSGIELQENLTKAGHSLPIIFVSGHGDISTSVKAIKAGAEDFLTKPVSKAVLIPAIERALEHYDKGHEHVARINAIRGAIATLTPREHEVFALVVLGLLNKQIAHELGTAERTVKAHRHSVMEKLKAKSVAELVSIAVQIGQPVA
jgi:FixJ family two-component response regulator